MSKRFTDTDKWKREWFRELPPKMKAAWQYLLDTCDHAGIWPADFKTLSHFVGEQITSEECEKHFTVKRFVPIGEKKYLLTGFVFYQYGSELNVKNNTHLSALRLLDQNDCTDKVRGELKIKRGKDETYDVTGESSARIRDLVAALLKKVPA